MKLVNFGTTTYRFSEYFNPDFGHLDGIIQVSGVIVNPEQTEVLIVSKDGLEWTLPGGKPEAGESPEDTLAREVLEETNVSLDLETIEPLFYLISEKQIAGNWEFDCTQLRYFSVADKVNTFKSDPAGDIRFANFVPIKDLDKWLSWGETTSRIISYLQQKRNKKLTRVW